MNLIIPNGSEILKQAREAALNRKNEKFVKQVRDLLIAKEAFENAVREISSVIEDLEKNDALAYKKLDRLSRFVSRVKSVVFERSNYEAPWLKYKDNEDEEVEF